MALTKIPADLSSTPGISDSSNATAITINSSEQVGIGVSPDTLLHVSTAGSGDKAKIGNGTRHGFIAVDSSGVSLGNEASQGGELLYLNEASGYVSVFTSGSERMKIESDGHVIMSRGASEYGLELRSAGNRAGLVIADPNAGTNTLKGSLLLLTDGTLRLGTQSVYNVHMHQSGYNTMPNQVYARMTDTADQTINGWNKIEFDSPTGTSSSSWSTTNNRFTIPISGRYLVDTRIRYATNVSYNYTGIYINGSPFNYNSGSQSTWGNDTTIGGAQIMDLNQNDYIELWAYSPTSVVLSGGSTRRYMHVWLLG